jgi:methionyl aminopeptidase
MRIEGKLPNNNNICVLHDEAWVKRQRIAGKIAGQTLSLLEKLVQEKTIKSLLELDKIAEEFIISNGCQPTFRGYKGFPNSVCISLDNERSHALVHGIPFDYKLQEGDLVSFDLGATYEGAIGDTAITCLYGEPRSAQHPKLIQDTKDALIKGINSIIIGKQLGVIGNAIYKSLHKSYGVINNYGGHSLNYNIPHAFPFVANKSATNEGIRICAGLTLAIEPMAVINGSTKTWTGKDGWTVFTDYTSAHEEHTVYVHEDGKVEIITARNGL